MDAKTERAIALRAAGLARTVLEFVQIRHMVKVPANMILEQIDLQLADLKKEIRRVV